MTFNLPPNRMLKLTKGDWKDVKYPTDIIVQAQLSPQDFFEPVGREAIRSCIPAGGKGFWFEFNANIGRMMLHGETMLPAMSVSFNIDGGVWSIIFVGRCMRVSQSVASRGDIDSVLTHCEHTIPALLSIATGLAIFCESVEIRLGDNVEARSETLIPSIVIRVIDAATRIDELKKGIELWGTALRSPRFILASTYYREASYFNSTYCDHNPYMHSLSVILKCAQAIEILFGSNYDGIRDKCLKLGISKDVIESEIVRINVARNYLGPAHSSGFVPSSAESDILRDFARRAVHTVQQILLQVSRVELRDHPYLIEPLSRDKDKECLIGKLHETLKRPLWRVDGPVEERTFVFNDPRIIELTGAPTDL